MTSLAWRSWDGQEQEEPHAKNRKEVDGEHSAAQPDIRGEDVDACVHETPRHEEPGEVELNGPDSMQFKKQEASCIKQDWPFELIGQVGADARFEAGPWIGAVRAPTYVPDGRCASDREQYIEKRRQNDMRCHWVDQRTRHEGAVSALKAMPTSSQLATAGKKRPLAEANVLSGKQLMADNCR